MLHNNINTPHQAIYGRFKPVAAALLLMLFFTVQPAFAVITPDQTWAANYASADIFEISKPEQLAQLAALVNAGSHDFTGKTIRLTENIDLGDSANRSWTPVGNGLKAFSGTFDGAGHTVSNLYIDSSDDYQALFGYIGEKGIVRNLTVSGSVKTTTIGSNVGIIVGKNNGTLLNCAAYGKVESSGGNVGGIAGMNHTDTASMINCLASVDVTGGGASVGGFSGTNEGGATTKNCISYGKVTASSKDIQYIGGVIGFLTSNLVNSVALGNITIPEGKTTAGGVAGEINNRGSYANCGWLSTENINKSLKALPDKDEPNCTSFDNYENIVTTYLPAENISTVLGTTPRIIFRSYPGIDKNALKELSYDVTPAGIVELSVDANNNLVAKALKNGTADITVRLVLNATALKTGAEVTSLDLTGDNSLKLSIKTFVEEKDPGATPDTPGTSGGSSGNGNGCNAAAGSLTLLMLSAAGMLLYRKRK